MTTEVKNGLRARREAIDMSREQLARAVGCSTTMIAHLELVPTQAMAATIAKVLDCEPGDLFGRVG